MSGSHSSSDDSNDSRKRPPEEVLYPDSSPKRPNCDESVHLKVLIPSIAAGAVIGKAGEAIGKIQKDTNTKVKISKQDEFYPGTTERVCLIVGSIDGVMCVHNYIMERIMEKPDPNPHATCEGRLNVERHKQVKILVPNSTAGMVIGKAGSYIQEIKDKTGAYVQISQKSREVNLPERCIIIAGDLDQTRAAVQLILAVIAADPQSANCPNLSYHDVRGPVASVYPTGSPYATPVVPCSVSSSWIGGSPVDPTTAAMMAAVFSPGAVNPACSGLPTVRNTGTTFDFFSGSYATPPDFSPLAALAASNQALGLTPFISQTALPSPGGGDLINAASVTPFGSNPTSGFGSAMVDPSSAVAVAAQQAALLAASFRCKHQLMAPEVQTLADHTASPSTFLSQGSMVSNTFRMTPSGLVGYPATGLMSPGIYSNIPSQQGFAGQRIGQSLVESHSSPPSAASGTSSTSSSPSIAASVALAALSAAAGASGASTTSMSMFQNPGTLFGMVPSQSVTPTGLALSHLATHPARFDPLSLTMTNLSPTSPSLFLALSEAAHGLQVIAPPATSPTSIPIPPQSSALGLYAVQSSNTPSLSGAPTICKKVICVPENVIGLILGPHGRSIVDLQATSGTVIQASQKGVYAPGTQNRLVTITGPQLNVQWVANLIEQRVAVEQLRRESSGCDQPTPSASSVSSDPEGPQRSMSLFHTHTFLPVNTVYAESPAGMPPPAAPSSSVTKTSAEQHVTVKQDVDTPGYQQQPPH
ncbi:hypothetical protein AHF37_02276 [Paragonimus kellicotti]|nr:hypothetical protein AHF37_02276 [Paragonimus kellicotti]